MLCGSRAKRGRGPPIMRVHHHMIPVLKWVKLKEGLVPLHAPRLLRGFRRRAFRLVDHMGAEADFPQQNGVDDHPFYSSYAQA